MPKRFVFDLDGTICTQTGDGSYGEAEPVREMVDRLKQLWHSGHHIIIHTARGSGSGVDWERLTRWQLQQWNVPFHELVMGKPFGHYYVDDRGIRPDEFLLRQW